MPPAFHPSALPHRCLAVLAVALVLALDFLAVSPQAHAWLHGHAPAAAAVGCTCPHDAPRTVPAPEVGAAPHESSAALPGTDAPTDAEAGCIVSLFSAGHTGVLLAPVILAGPQLFLLGEIVVPPASRRAATAHRFPPGCGPPV
jgi:hypothetical protein